MGAVIVLYGTGNGLAGVAEEGDLFGSNLVGCDQQPGGSATNATRSRPGAPPASRLNGR